MTVGSDRLGTDTEVEPEAERGVLNLYLDLMIDLDGVIYEILVFEYGDNRACDEERTRRVLALEPTLVLLPLIFLLLLPLLVRVALRDGAGEEYTLYLFLL